MNKKMGAVSYIVSLQKLDTALIFFILANDSLWSIISYNIYENILSLQGICRKTLPIDFTGGFSPWNETD